MTLRGVALLFAPLPLLAAGARVGVLLWIGVAAFVGAVAAVAVDGRRAPGQARIRAVRDHPDLLSVGRPGHVRLRLDVAGGAAEATVRDEHPLGMRIGTVVDTSGINAEPAGPAPEAVGRAPGPAPEAVVVRTRIPATVVYSVTPPARGRGEFGRTTVRAEGPWRLGFRQATVGEPTTVRVDPDLSALSVYEALARRGQLAELGVRSLRNPGEGTEFERIRDAVPDDPMRSINWKATARTGRLMAAELIPERSQPVVVCLDHGRLMGVGAGPLTKLDCAINAALLLVHVALRAGDRAGLLSFSDHVTVALPPRAGRAQLRAFLDAVEPLAPGVAEADYDEALAFLSTWQRRRALLAIFTDVLDPDQGQALLRQCARLRRRHLPLVITVRDPALDDTARRRPDDAAAAYARSVAGTLLAERQDTLRMLARSGIDTLDADARTLSPRLVNRYLELKRRARL